jgi:hypothetical protein
LIARFGKKAIISSFIISTEQNNFAFRAGIGSLRFDGGNFGKGKIRRIEQSRLEISGGRRFNWADPQFDDSAWERVEETIIKPDLMSRGNWNGRAWFRLRLRVDDALKRQNLRVRDAANRRVGSLHR